MTIEVIYPNFKLVQSGVSTTVFRLAPFIRARGVDLQVFGVGLPQDLPSANLPAVIRRLFHRRGAPAIWHARRNIEMLAGTILKSLGANVKLVFTSAAQRTHTAYTRRLMRRMDRIVYTSATSASFVPIEGPVIGHGVDTSAYAVADRAAMKRLLGLDADTRYLASFGAVRPSKGTDLFVDALLDALPSRPRWCALIVGFTTNANKSYRAQLEARVAAAGLADRIVFTGHVPDATPYLAAVDLCVAPSRSEGFGLTTLEAMASATPVVASRAGSYPETVLDGATGLLVDTGDAGSLAHALARLMDDDARREAMGHAGREHVVANWSLDREADALLAVYRELVGATA